MYTIHDFAIDLAIDNFHPAAAKFVSEMAMQLFRSRVPVFILLFSPSTDSTVQLTPKPYVFDELFVFT